MQSLEKIVSGCNDMQISDSKMLADCLPWYFWPASFTPLISSDGVCRGGETGKSPTTCARKRRRSRLNVEGQGFEHF